jgi:hypothetical protein
VRLFAALVYAILQSLYACCDYWLHECAGEFQAVECLSIMSLVSASNNLKPGLSGVDRTESTARSPLTYDSL